ncbi:PAS domain-containing protein [Candidatus Poribacteria bacterium]|nr:PAS domain-containing protein [Candidatus Poribacteria bacterium]
MRTVLIISDRRESIDKLRSSLPDECSVLEANSDEDALKLVQNVGVDLAFIDPPVLNDEVLKTASKLKSYKPSSVVICMLSNVILEGSENAEPDSSDSGFDNHHVFDFFIRKPILLTEAKKVINSAFEKQHLLQELAYLKKGATNGQNHAVANATSQASSAASPDRRVSNILTAMAKALTTSFDLDKLTNLFLEFVAEMLKLNRVSLAIYDSASGEYRIETRQRGLMPKIASSIKLRAEDALPSWMIKEGRLITKSETESMIFNPSFRQINSELEMLQAVASIPLLAGGNLMGILSIGSRVTGVPYTHFELETLFILASHVAVLIQDIGWYHQLQYQNTYLDNILRHMSSGVLTINLDGRVTIYNPRAAEILKIPSDQVLNKDLRTLPSPLGDLLFETLTQGKTYQRVEKQLAWGKLPLEVSTYQIEDERGKVCGSVMVFEDLSQQKQLEQERRRSTELDLFNGIMATMAHEIKNPLVSIHTFVELLPSQFEDTEFRNHFAPIILNDVKRLDELVDKMVSFADTEPHRFDADNLEALLNECMDLLKAENPDKSVEVSFKCQAQIPSVKYDKGRMTKGFLYLMRFLVRGADSPAKMAIRLNLLNSNEKERRGGTRGTPYIEIEMRGDSKRVPPESLTHLFSPFSESHTNGTDLGLWVSQRIVEDHGGRLEAKSLAEDKIACQILIPTPTSNY